jgi:stage II sporulation protein D
MSLDLRKMICVSLFMTVFLVYSKAGSIAPSANLKVSIKLFASVDIDWVEIETPDGMDYQVFTDEGKSFVLPGGTKARFSSGSRGVEIARDAQTIQTERLTISEKKEKGSYLYISSDKTERRLYSGGLSISRVPGKGSLKIIHFCRIEHLVHQLLLSEFSKTDNPEAMKAVSVAIRTYIYYNKGRHKDEGCDFCDTTHCQAFKGWNNDNIPYVESIRSLLAKILAPSKDLVLTYNGKVIEGYYSACCGGKLTTPEIIWGGLSDFPYRNIKSPFCVESTFYRWERELNRADFVAIFGLSIADMKIELIRNETDQDFVKNVTLSDGKNNLKLTVGDFRRKIAERAGWNKILSHSFWAEVAGDKVIFRGNGFGHSIGLCEACAYEMGRKGYSWKNILDYFYFPAELTSAAKLAVKYL